MILYSVFNGPYILLMYDDEYTEYWVHDELVFASPSYKDVVMYIFEHGPASFQLLL